MGNDSIHQTSSHIYILCIDYSPMAKGEPCPVTLYYTDPIPEFVDASPLITPQGNLLLTGGTGKKENPSHNFYPLAHVFLFHLGSDEFCDVVISSFLSPIPWLLGSILLLAVAIICIYLFYRQPKQDQEVENEVETPETPKTPDPKEAANEELMQRIHHLVVEEKQFLNCDLTVLALAKQLGTHRNNVSACVNEQKGCNFTQYINGYRVECAKQLMLKYPDLKMNAIGSDSGFANDTSFFRTFKALTGQTPNEWKASQLSNPK